MTTPPIEHLLQDHLGLLEAYVACRLDRDLRQREPVEDIVQSAVREILASSGAFRFEGLAAFRGWLVRAVEFKIANKRRYWRARKRGAASPEPVSDLDLLPASWLMQQSPSEVAARRESLVRLRDALDELEEEDRQVLTMRRIAGLPAEQIAEQLGTTASTVRRRLGRIMTRLGRKLAPERG